MRPHQNTQHSFSQFLIMYTNKTDQSVCEKRRRCVARQVLCPSVKSQIVSTCTSNDSDITAFQLKSQRVEGIQLNLFNSITYLNHLINIWILDTNCNFLAKYNYFGDNITYNIVTKEITNIMLCICLIKLDYLRVQKYSHSPHMVSKFLTKYLLISLLKLLSEQGEPQLGTNSWILNFRGAKLVK